MTDFEHSVMESKKKLLEENGQQDNGSEALSFETEVRS